MKDDITVIQERVLDARCEEVWEAWTQPHLMAQWLCPTGMTVGQAIADVRVSGKYLIEMRQGEKPIPTPPEFGDALVAEGHYEVVEPPNLLVFSWSWKGRDESSRVRVELYPVDQRTKLTLTHSLLVSIHDQQFHADGWLMTLDHLQAFFTAEIINDN